MTHAPGLLGRLEAAARACADWLANPNDYAEAFHAIEIALAALAAVQPLLAEWSAARVEADHELVGTATGALTAPRAAAIRRLHLAERTLLAALAAAGDRRRTCPPGPDAPA